MMLMMLVHWVQLKAGANANDAHDARCKSWLGLVQVMLMMLAHWVQVRAGAGANDAHDARPLGVSQIWG